jgi:hypothetical protein
MKYLQNLSFELWIKNKDTSISLDSFWKQCEDDIWNLARVGVISMELKHPLDYS